ncbi:MAG: TadE/TadG family type IV pilus assembly protein [Thermoguttaceae bacterium]
MGRAILQSCWPWMAVWLGGCAGLWLLARLSRAKPDWGRLRRLHPDQCGTAQSLSFVLTLPVFVIVILFIVQLSQLMIGTMAVHYAAYAAARAATVWIPARIGIGPEAENCVLGYALDPDAPEQVMPILDPSDEAFGPAEGGLTYRIYEEGFKYRKIAWAAILALVPISPSRDLGLDLPGEAIAPADILQRAFHAMAPQPASGPGAFSRRLRNKLAYAIQNTAVEVRFFHPNSEPPLVAWDPPHEFREGQELGWQDPITVTVHYNLALLPGPGRLLFRTRHRDPRTIGTILPQANTYVFTLTGSARTGLQSATLGNEGEKSVLPYVFAEY